MNTSSHKIAHTEYPVLDIIRQRWSPRAYSEQAISAENLNTLFEAASWAASGGNFQPWMFIYAHKGSEQFDVMLECLNPSNRLWAKDAAVLVLTIVQTERAPGKPNRLAFYDAGSAVTSLLLQAVTMNIYARQMGGYDMTKTVQAFNIAEGYEPLVFIALGYLGDEERLPTEELRHRERAPRSRKSLNEFVFEKSPFVQSNANVTS